MIFYLCQTSPLNPNLQSTKNENRYQTAAFFFFLQFDLNPEQWALVSTGKFKN
jgi:hypothetical protein